MLKDNSLLDLEDLKNQMEAFLTVSLKHGPGFTSSHPSISVQFTQAVCGQVDTFSQYCIDIVSKQHGELAVST